MKPSELLEKMLRSRILWITVAIFIIPLIVTLIIVSMREYWSFGFIIEGFIESLAMGIIFVGASILIGIWPQIDSPFFLSLGFLLPFTLILYIGYIWFIIKVKKLPVKVLYWISLLICILALLVVKGCVTMSTFFT